MRKVAAAAGPLPSDMLLSDADALIASGDLPAASAALQVAFTITGSAPHTPPPVTPPQSLMQEQPDMVITPPRFLPLAILSRTSCVLERKLVSNAFAGG